MPLDLARDVVLFVLVVFGLGMPTALAAARWPPMARVVVGVGTALVAIYLVEFLCYLSGAPSRATAILPLAATVVTAARLRQVRTFLAEAEVGQALALWLLLALWCLGWQALVVNYSGGLWTNDWLEHYDRARFFVEHWPRDTAFLGSYALPARPPLANVVTAAFLSLTETTFIRYQVFTTLLSTLAFLPALLLYRAFRGGPRAGAGLLLLFMTNPMFVQNATFPWTKLVTTFFVLGGVAFVQGSSYGPWGARMGWLMLTAGLLAHYSAGPWIVAAALGVLVARRRQLAAAAYWREQASIALCCGLLLASWIGWSWRVYGLHDTLATNTTVTAVEGHTATEQLGIIAGNVVNTILPPFLRTVDETALRQDSTAGALRDFFFNLYQHNLLFAFGSGAVIVLGWLVARDRASRHPFWWTLVPVATVLGIAVHSAPNEWGLVVVCLQPLVLLGLTWVAASGPELPPSLRGLLVAGMAVDLLLGVMLHFGLESFALSRWLDPGRREEVYAYQLSAGGIVNYKAKLYQLGQPYLGDHASTGSIAALLGMLLVVAVWLTIDSTLRPRARYRRATR